MRSVDIAVANEEDFQKALGLSTTVDVESGKLEPAKYRELAEKALAAYPSLLILA